ncbi:MAG: hypothetical protein J2P23_12595 [Microlunatus sp.]|nr:hypothetical protein [Microlunatus sp.]
MAHHSLRTRLGVLLTAALLISAGPLVAPAAAAPPGPVGNHELRPFEPAAGEGPDVPAPKSNAPSRVPASHVPRVAGLPVGGATGVAARIDGLTMQNQRDSNAGNSFSIEPPDQGLCAGNGLVIEGVNNVFAIYTSSGQQVSAPQSFDPFWNGVAEIVRHADGTATFGPFVSDPKCYYDPALNRFFMTELEIATDPNTGAFTGRSFEDLAVSKTSSPTTDPADWHLYSLEVTNDGSNGTPEHPGCPCFGDQPLIGADQYGFYISTNEFPIFTGGFNGAQLYAFDKAALTRGVMRVQRIENPSTPLAEGTAYSVQPATSPSAGQWATAANGTEYFLSALEFTGGLDNRIATWALTNTASLATPNQNAQLSHVVITSEVYGAPPSASQRRGPTPLADALKYNKLELVNSNDDRMNQVVYAAGRLWSGLNTREQGHTGATNAGIAYFVVTPNVGSGGLSATIANQGYVAVDGNNVLFPAIGVNDSGAAVLVFSLVGPSYYPSAAMVHLSPDGSINSGVQIIQGGTKPDDGFSGYPAEGGAGIGRWGDYSAAVADSSGRVWVATEYIPGTFGFPPYLANWGTFIASVTPQSVPAP